MAINFPDNPSDGDIASIGGVTYTYTASANSWKPPAPGASASTLTDLNISDGTAGQLLTTDGNNNFSFTSVSSASSTEIFADMTALIAKTGMNAGDQGLVLDNNKLFMYTGSAWYLIATMVNNSPTAITNVNSSYDLSIDGTPTVITATSTDPEGFPLTWSYAITSGSLGSTATISQADNVFTITPSTDSADSGEFTLTISATDGESSGIVNKVISISLAFVVTNSRYTSLLVTATGTSDNNNITDSSTNNHSITLNGNPYASTFSPYRSGGYSTYFATSGSTSTSSGTGQTIQSDLTSELTLDTNDFTISCWVYGISKLRDYPRILQIGPQNTPWGASQLAIGYKHNDDNDSIMLAMQGIGGNALLIASGPINDNQWYHVAVTRSGSTFTLYINGVSAGTYTSTGSATGTGNKSIQIGGNTAGDSDFHGYIADVNVINGTAIYTSNFAPPTEPLAADTNTKFSFGNLPYFKDQSTSDHSLTVSSGILIKPFSPYDYREYDSTDHGGSVYFSGTGDYLVASNNTDTFGTGDFTLEGWIYRTATGATWQSIVAQRNGESTSVNDYAWGVNNSGYMYFYTGAHVASTPTGVIKLNQWHHIAFTRSGSTLRQFVDGIQQVSGTSSNNLTYGPMSIGSNNVGSEHLTAFLSDIKTTKGTALYTSNFTPPTEPISSANSLLHIKGTDASIIDKSQSGNRIQLIGGATGSNTESKFANSYSMYFDGSDDRLVVEDPFNFIDFSNGESYTVETWINATDLSGNTWRTICNQGTSGVYGPIYLSFLSDKLHALASHNGSSYALDTRSDIGSSGLATLLPNTWYHIAYTWDGSNYTFYINGVLLHTIAKTGTPVAQGDLGIGARAGNYEKYSGYIQDFRITKGLVRYTANFTPPTGSLKG